jgi:inner membrane protein
MATIFSHVLVPITMRVGLGPNIVSNRLLAAACIAAMLPDADVVSFKFGIEYASQFGHRGASHSVAFAIGVGLIAMLFSKHLHASRLSTFFVMMLATLSHALLDAMTSGGHGVAIAWPLNDERYFLPWRPIRVSPIGSAFFTARGMETLVSEAQTIALWCLIIGSVMFGIRRVASPKDV